MRVQRMVFLAAALVFAPMAASSQQPVPPRSELAERAARRFPQPVRVGALAGRRLLDPSPRQRVLGLVGGTARSSDGAVSLLVHTGGWFGIGDRTVAVPIEAVALLGEHVALIDLTPEALAGLPASSAAAGTEIPPGEEIRVGIVKPFH